MEVHKIEGRTRNVVVEVRDVKEKSTRRVFSRHEDGYNLNKTTAPQICEKILEAMQ